MADLCNMLLYFMLVLLLPTLATSQAYLNVSLGSYLIADNNNSTWSSPSGDFAFGLRQMPSGGYLLAIWFNNIPERTIVWAANRDDLAEQGSKVQLFADGRFELDDPSGQQIWNLGVGRPAGVAYGAMLDTGNFVLAGDSSAVLWQTFDEPSDTMLPTQMLNQGVSLVSGFSETNLSSGRFRLSLQPDGNLIFYTRNVPTNDDIYGYWSSNTLGRGFQVMFNQSGYIFLAEKNGTIVDFLSSNGASTGQYYQRAVLDYDGVFRHYVYPKSGNSTGGRPPAWSVSDFLPSNICLLIQQSWGPGACGFNSICSLGIDQKPDCVCPTGYSPVDPNDRMSGCKPDFVAQVCDDQESQDASHFTLVDMPNTDFPGDDYGFFQPDGEDGCRKACLDDCFCALALYRGNNCWKKKFPLSNGRVDVSLVGKSLLKIRTNNVTLATPGSNQNKWNRMTLIITGSVLFSSLLLLIILSAFMLFASRSKGRGSNTVRPLYSAVTGFNIRSFIFEELQEATDGFKEELGRGACSTVYKGSLKNESGGLIAVKKLNELAKDVEKEFKSEVNTIGRTNHKNLVQLLGYCDEGENKLLVYEYMSNGSVASFLFKNSRPNWYRRVEIAFSTARGLCYLHEECSTQIIHCDIKPQNVLLDESLTAKISDFGLAKILRPDQTGTTTAIRGTRGYVAPEWFRNLPITVKVDVYSFGVLLLELICCRRNVETHATNENEVILVDWACDCYKEGTMHLLVADDGEALDDIKRFEKFVMIAVWCIQESPSLRPNMKRVLQMLEGSVQVPLPPDPESFIN
ncbi:G-type lectin S-receptor-like serine/threonine-protein kinase LECRK3 [Henckelia pumila]|uniref:G-type lectin S-receptor-like serine/threonine-protein kinase LECRK3 n=1 Tax=Henckelia pumila TaxID=405737 RepID=UPI003C6E53DC